MHKYQKRHTTLHQFSRKLSSLFVAFSVYSSTALNHRINSTIFCSLLAPVQKHTLHLITVLVESTYADGLCLHESIGISGFRAQKRLKKMRALISAPPSSPLHFITLKGFKSKKFLPYHIILASAVQHIKLTRSAVLFPKVTVQIRV